LRGTKDTRKTVEAKQDLAAFFPQKGKRKLGNGSSGEWVGCKGKKSRRVALRPRRAGRTSIPFFH